MTLYIDTTQNNLVEIRLKIKDRNIAVSKIKSDRTQAERLLPAVEKLLKSSKLKLSDLRSIKVANKGGSFTSLRIGVVTANALGFALGVPVEGSAGKSKNFGKFNIVTPKYGYKPDITVKSKKL